MRVRLTAIPCLRCALVSTMYRCQEANKMLNELIEAKFLINEEKAYKESVTGHQAENQGRLFWNPVGDKVGKHAQKPIGCCNGCCRYARQNPKTRV